MTWLIGLFGLLAIIFAVLELMDVARVSYNILAASSVGLAVVLIFLRRAVASRHADSK